MVDVNLTNALGALSSAQTKRPDGDAAPKATGASFGHWLEQAMQQVNDMQQHADEAAGKLATGENKDIHGTMISIQKADVALNLMMEVRNKVIAAYDEIRRMQF